MKADSKKLIDEIEVAINMTLDRLAISPAYGVYLHAREQLESIRSALLSGNATGNGKVLSVDLGVMAVKELDTSDPEYADKLCLVDFLYKKIN